MKSKIIIGIIIGIVIIVGIGYSASITENSNNIDIDESSLSSEEITDNTEGEKFTLKLEDSVTAVNP